MGRQATLKVSPTESDYATGKHQRWEAEAHAEAERFKFTHDRPWTIEERKIFIDNFIRQNPWSVVNEITGCRVCEKEIAEAAARGDNPFKINQELRRYLKSIKSSFKPGKRGIYADSRGNITLNSRIGYRVNLEDIVPT